MFKKYLTFIIILGGIYSSYGQDSINKQIFNEGYLKGYFPKFIDHQTKEAFSAIEKKGYYFQYCNFLITRHCIISGVLLKINNEVDIKFYFKETIFLPKKYKKRHPCELKKILNSYISKIIIVQNGKAFEITKEGVIMEER